MRIQTLVCFILILVLSSCSNSKAPVLPQIGSPVPSQPEKPASPDAVEPDASEAVQPKVGEGERNFRSPEDFRMGGDPPERWGDLLPSEGQSLFDHLIGSDKIPFPFPKLLDKIASHVETGWAQNYSHPYWSFFAAG